MPSIDPLDPAIELLKADEIERKIAALQDIELLLLKTAGDAAQKHDLSPKELSGSFVMLAMLTGAKDARDQASRMETAEDVGRTAKLLAVIGPNTGAAIRATYKAIVAKREEARGKMN